MRIACSPLRMLLALALLACSSPVLAAPITGGTGPGGLETTDGTSALQLWLRSDQGITLTGGGVSQWNNLSGHAGRDAVQTNAVDRPVLIAGPNGQTALEFGTTDVRHLVVTNFLNGTNFPNQAEGFWSIRTEIDPPVNAALAGSPHSYGSGNAVHPWVDGNIYDGFFMDIRPLTGNPVTPLSTFHNYDISSQTGSWRNRINGSVLYTEATGNFLRQTTPLTIGEGEAGAGERAWEGEMTEHFLYNRVLNNAERRIISNYLSARYAMPLAGAEERYSGDDPGPGNYDFEVFGIGQEVGAANQVLNAGMAGFGFEATTLDDNDWMLAGHDGTVNDIITLEGADPFAQEPMTGERWERVYYVDKTGALDATLGFDFEDSGLTSPTGSNTFHLLYSADDDFSDGWEELAVTSTITGGLVTFNVLNANLLDGYYTLGLNIVQVPEPSTFGLLMLGVAGLAGQTRRRGRGTSEKKFASAC